MPGICYQTNNPVLGIELFQLLLIYDYRFRYDCYLHVYNKTMTENAYLA